LFGKLDINGNPFIGVYCHANEEFALVPRETPKKVQSKIEECLDVEIIKTTVAKSSIIGVLTCSNSHGIVVTNFAEEKELGPLIDKYNVLFIPDVLNAVGNNILVNDKFALVHPDFEKETKSEIADVLDVEVLGGKIAKVKTVGAAAYVTNKGLLCHPHTSKKELESLEEKFGVSAEIGTANYGTALVGACMIANSKGAVVGLSTTPIEIGRIEEALNL
jgi:translation initiation factor 6